MICSPESIIDDRAVAKLRNKTVYCISYFSPDYNGEPGIRTHVEIYLGSWFEANFMVAEKACMLGQLWCGNSRLLPGVLADQGGRKGKKYGERLLKVPGPLKTAPPAGE